MSTRGNTTIAKGNGLPDGWEWSTLGGVSEKPQYGWTTKASHEAGKLKLLRTTDITSGSVDWSSVPCCSEEPEDVKKYLIESGDIFVSRAGSVGISFLINKPERAVFASYLIRFRPKSSIDAKYFYYYLKSPAYWGAISASKSGIAVPNVNASKLAQVSIPVAPLDQQKRIVAEIEKQFSRLDEAVAGLKRVKANLKRYKAAVLKAAVEGRLVETETSIAHREGRSYETGEQLLQRILETRRSKWKGKYKEPAAPDTTDLPELPEGWAWASIGQTFNVYTGATPSRSRPEYWGGNIPWVSSGEVSFCRIRKTRECISSKGLSNSSVRLHPAGTVLLGMIGEGKTRGQAAILDIEASNNQNSAAIRVSETEVLPEYIFSVLEKVYEDTRRRGSGGNQPALNKERVRQIQFPLPPTAEQHRIITEVNRHLSFIHQIDAQVAASLNRAQALRKTILAKAFGNQFGRE